MSAAPETLIAQNTDSTIKSDITVLTAAKSLAQNLPAISDLADQLGQCDIEDTSSSVWVDSLRSLRSAIDSMSKLPKEPPSLYIDVEGVDLSRYGTVSILQILVSPLNRTYLIDIHTLGTKAFTTANSNGTTLKAIFESCSIPKVFFDVRNDSDALYSHFDIHLAGIQDIQLMELATRTFSRKCVNGLSRCIERDGELSIEEKESWKSMKDQGRKNFAPELGGSYEVFNIRPISSEMKAYCVQDVQLMPRLWKIYSSKLSSQWAKMVEIETKKRVSLSQSPTFNGKGRHMALGPWPVEEVLDGFRYGEQRWLDGW